jgi:hypothetical protein
MSEQAAETYSRGHGRGPRGTRGDALYTVRDREAPGSDPGPPTIPSLPA